MTRGEERKKKKTTKKGNLKEKRNKTKQRNEQKECIKKKKTYEYWKIPYDEIEGNVSVKKRQIHGNK